MTAKELIRELAACDDLNKEVVIITKRGYEPVDSVNQGTGHGRRITLDPNDMLYDFVDLQESREQDYTKGATEGKR